MIGLVFYGQIWKNWNYEVQLFSVVRDFHDGITFFDLKVNLDRFKSEHTPAFQFEITIFNIYSHLWIYQNNFDDFLDEKENY